MANSELKVTEINAVTGLVVERELTSEEKENHELLVATQKQFDIDLKAKEEARTSALAKLAALGLTEEEIAAL
jgi:hypothetical protein